MHLSLAYWLLFGRLAAIVIEAILGARGIIRAHYEWKDTLASLAMRAGNVAVNIAMTGVMFAGLQWAYGHRILHFEAGVLAWVILFFLDDFTYYWFHRISHECRFWWAAHVNHHSSRCYNLSTAARQSWTSVIVGTWMPWLPLAWLGYTPTMILAMQSINLFYQFWLHTESVGRLPAWIEAVFNTPSHHRVHHASNPQYLDRNYAGALIIWDRWFGTFASERDDDRPIYGILHNVESYNPIVIAFHEWIAMARDLCTIHSLREAVGFVFAMPGWRPDGKGDTSDSVRAAWLRSRSLPTV
jgi:sterol desaturase/sphingolipid hydroxylase (fatty acid hydroxylase superfamily)